MITITITITSVGVQRRDAFIRTLEYGGPQWYQVKLMCLYVYLYFCMSICLYHFLAIIHVDHNCAQIMKPQATGSNLLSGSIICLPVRLYTQVLGFLYLYLFPVWGSSVAMQLSPHGVRSNLVGYSWSYIPICLSLYLSVWSSASIFGNNKIADRYFTQHMRPQAMGSNPLSRSIICPSVRLYICTSVRSYGRPCWFLRFRYFY